MVHLFLRTITWNYTIFVRSDSQLFKVACIHKWGEVDNFDATFLRSYRQCNVPNFMESCWQFFKLYNNNVWLNFFLQTHCTCMSYIATIVTIPIHVLNGSATTVTDYHKCWWWQFVHYSLVSERDSTSQSTHRDHDGDFTFRRQVLDYYFLGGRGTI